MREEEEEEGHNFSLDVVGEEGGPPRDVNNGAVTHGARGGREDRRRRRGEAPQLLTTAFI